MDTKLHTSMGCGVYPTREQLKKMLLEKQEAKIKQIKPEKDQNDRYEWISNSVAKPHQEGVRDLPHPKLWYLLVVLKKAGISLEEVGNEIGLTFLGNVICQFKLFNFRSCNYVCFLYNYFHKVSRKDWPAKKVILEKLAKYLPKMEQTRRKAEKSFNAWWREEMLKQIIYYRYWVSPHRRL